MFRALPVPYGPTSAGNTAQAAPTTLSGTVTAALRQTLVQTPAGSLVIAGRLDVPVGSTVSFDVLNRSVPQPLTSPPVPPSPTGWTLLAETVQQQPSFPAMLEMISVLPAANGRLVANMAAFVAAARSGDGRWPGETSLKALERSGPRGTALARFLRGEILSKSPSASRPESQGAGGAGAGEEWHTLTMPFLNGETIEKITLSLHRPPDDPAEEKPRRDGRKGGGADAFLDRSDLKRPWTRAD